MLPKEKVICKRFGERMHELGILRHVVKTVSGIAQKNRILSIRHIALEVGEESGFVPLYLKKLFPVAADAYPLLHKAELRISMVSGRNLMIKEIGY